MDEKDPLLGALVRRNSGSPRWEVFLSLIAFAGFITLGFNVRHASRPDQEAWDINISGASGAKSAFSWTSIPPSRTLEWHSCFDGEYDCARLDVPLDWLDPTEDDRVVLAVARLRATETKAGDYKGPVFFNPGGPGGSGIWALKDHGKQLQTVVGQNYDIVTFDPRGIGASVPRIECWGSSQRRHNWAMQETPVLDSHQGVYYDDWARAAAYSMACEQSHSANGLLEHIGTASHARDMLEILNQMGEEKLQYWGFSYGTILGGTFAALWPDKVGRLVSDGNVDYEEWYNNVHINSVRDADAVMEAFYTLCHKAGPQQCAFYGSSPENIQERHLAILESLRVQPVLYMPPPTDAFDATLPEIVTYSKLRQLAATSLYRPNFYFTHLAEILAGLEQGDGAPYYNFVTRHGTPFPNMCSIEGPPPTEPLTGDEPEGNDDAFPTILCADGKPLDKDPREFQAYVDEMGAISKSNGAIVVHDRIACAGRTVRPKWNFKGPFRTNTSFPILYIANMADNITPLVSARNNSAGFEGSVVMIQNSYGVSESYLSSVEWGSCQLGFLVPADLYSSTQHTSLAAPSLCTAKAVRNYFQDGVLPEDGTRCDPQLLPFGIEGEEVGDVDDRELAAASRELSARATWGLPRGELAF